MTSSNVTLERHASIAVVRLNRPQKLNALLAEMLDELATIFKRFESDSDVRAIILTGTGDRAFSSGTDIEALANMDAASAESVSRRGQAVCDQIASSNVPVIAAVEGIAAGGGFELVLACHMRFASTAARFSLPEIKIGMIPAYGGTQRLARVLGTGRAFEMMLSGRTISAEDGYRMGLINRVTESASLLAETETVAQEISKLAPLAISACLEAVTKGIELPLEDGLALEARLFSNLFATDDVREGTRAFLEKRIPVFKGQ